MTRVCIGNYVAATGMIPRKVPSVKHSSAASSILNSRLPVSREHFEFEYWFGGPQEGRGGH